jgi:hypothetical protein
LLSAGASVGWRRTVWAVTKNLLFLKKKKQKDFCFLVLFRDTYRLSTKGAGDDYRESGDHA